jgi:hypothetical protein
VRQRLPDSLLPALADRIPKVFDPGGGAAPAPVPKE